MLQRVHIGESSKHRMDIVEKLAWMRIETPTTTVVDVGGSADGWSAPVVDAIVDLHPVETRRWFKANLNRTEDWGEILSHVAEHGKFSYAICSHTIEDLANPMLVLEMLPRIAEAGAILVPSKHREFSRIEGSHLGYIHHRWIFDAKDGVLVGYPKLGFLEYASEFHKLGHTDKSVEELLVTWEGGIPYRIVNGDYLGPTSDAVRQYYRALL